MRRTWGSVLLVLLALVLETWWALAPSRKAGERSGERSDLVVAGSVDLPLPPPPISTVDGVQSTREPLAVDPSPRETNRLPPSDAWCTLEVAVERLDGAPVVGARIEALPRPEWRGVSEPLVAVTDAEGSVRLQGDVGVAYDIVAWIETMSIRRYSIRSPARVVITLPECIPWSVIVRDGSGAPVVGALVACGRRGGAADPLRSETDATGRAVLLLPVGAASRFSWVRARDGRYAEFASPASPELGAETVITLDRLLRFVGRVRLRDGGAPGPGAFQVGEGCEPVALSADGAFELPITVDSPEHFLLSGPGFVDRAFTVAWDRVWEVASAASSRIAVGDLTVDASRRLAVTVADADGGPVAGARIHAWGVTEQSGALGSDLLVASGERMLFEATALSAAGGDARLELPLGPPAALEVNHPRFATWRGDVAPDDASPEVRVLLGAPARVVVHVTLPGSERVVDGTPIDLVPVDPAACPITNRLHRAARLAWFNETTAYSDGLPPGEYTLRLRDPSYLEVSQRIELLPGLNEVGITLQEGLVVEGRVLTQEGEPVADAIVNLGDMSPSEDRLLSWQTRTDVDGRFRFAGAPAGCRTLRVWATVKDPRTGTFDGYVEHEVTGTGWFELRLAPWTGDAAAAPSK